VTTELFYAVWPYSPPIPSLALFLENVSVVISANLLQKAVELYFKHKANTANRLVLLALVFSYLGSLFVSYYLLPTNKRILPTITIDSASEGKVTGGLVAHADRYWYVLVPARSHGQLVPISDSDAKTVAVTR